jgi:hypothetical protein
VYPIGFDGPAIQDLADLAIERRLNPENGSGTSVPMPCTSRTIGPRFTVSIQMVDLLPARPARTLPHTIGGPGGIAHHVELEDVPLVLATARSRERDSAAPAASWVRPSRAHSRQDVSRRNHWTARRQQAARSPEAAEWLREVDHV